MIPIEVKLIDYTGAGNPDGQYAAKRLIYTKSTRLEQGEGLEQKIDAMEHEQIIDELQYMANTIPSSWEFTHYTFQIKNVTRAFTHQFVRTRTGSYAQQTMRMLNKKDFTYRIPPRLREPDKGKELSIYQNGMRESQIHYDRLIEMGIDVEDARGVLPTNIHTNIIAGFNLRTVAEMAKSRTGLRTQDEYREVMELMIGVVLEVHPWAVNFLIPEEMKNIKEIENFVLKMAADGSINHSTKYDILKNLDKLRKGER